MPGPTRALRRPTPLPLARLPAALLAGLALLAGCAPHQAGYVWDGRRGYDGNGDYGYDLDASRAEARSYRARATGSYRVPGPPSDPWGPHIREASARFQVPERWIRAIMRQESGGRLYDGSGRPITSPVGAMGLMQVMPRTYDTLAARHGLGPDPYEPRDNILAGTAYIRAMADRYGAPGFAAAYNAGPERVDNYLAGVTVLPDETVQYVASVGPNLGIALPASGPFSLAAIRAVSPADQAYAGGGLTGDAYYSRGGTAPQAYGAVAAEDPSRRAYAGGGMSGAAYYGGGASDAGATGYGAAPEDDPSRRAFDGGGLVTPGAPTGTWTPRARD